MGRKTSDRGFSHGATFDWAKIRARLDASGWEPSSEGDELEERRVWLGTIFAITPSEKFYAPFACSNVAGDCPMCEGSGKRPEPRTGRRARKRAARRARDFTRGIAKRGYLFSPVGAAYAARVAKYRDAACRVNWNTCPTCDGLGSVSAARDERWRDALEHAAKTIGAFVDYNDDSIFIVECRDAEKQSEEAAS